MSPRFFLMVAGLGVSAAVARAQTAPSAPELPGPPLTFPIKPAPFDEKTQALPDANTVRTFAVALKYVKPSVMAYWLDPGNHEMPSFMSGVTSPPSDFVWPKGFDRIVALDPQNVLLIYGTTQGANKVKETIASLDRPQIRLAVNGAQIVIDATLYWLDSRAPTKQQWQRVAPVPRTARPGELEALSTPGIQEREGLRLLPSLVTSNVTVASLLLPSLETLESPKNKPTTRNFRTGQAFHSLMPRINPDSAIDPNIQSHRSNPSLVVRRDGLLLSPTEVTNDSLKLYIAALGHLHFSVTNLVLRDGDTFLLSGDATEQRLKSPSPDFSTFVLAVKIHILPQAPPLPEPEPAK